MFAKIALLIASVNAENLLKTPKVALLTMKDELRQHDEARALIAAKAEKAGVSYAAYDMPEESADAELDDASDFSEHQFVRAKQDQVDAAEAADEDEDPDQKLIDANDEATNFGEDSSESD